MKNLLLLCLGVLILNFNSNAQKKKSTAKLIVPEMVSNSFTSNFSEAANKKWEKNNLGNYVAKFGDASQEHVAIFNKEGVLLKSNTTFNNDNIPGVVTDAVNGDYEGAKINKAEKITIERMNPYYRVEITTALNKNKILLISENGLVTE